MIQIIGDGLAGSEAAWQAASCGVDVTLCEMRPSRPTRVHRTDCLAELVCSNSFRGAQLENAVGLLKEEMRRLGSLVMRVADATRVPAGNALAVDREQFAKGMTAALESHPLITVRREEVVRVPDADVTCPVIVATGPLTSDALSDEIVRLVGSEHLYFYDAISPIVSAESIDRTKIFAGSRYGRSTPVSQIPSSLPPRCLPAADSGDGDYLNCPLDEGQYVELHRAILDAERATVHDFDDTKFFEGCLPIEVMAHRGLDTLRFGPMKPVGLQNPVTGRRPYAVVQLRQDDLAAEHYSLVGFQTQLKWGEQQRVFRLIPGLEQAEFIRYGMIHRNTYINAPSVLLPSWQMRNQPEVLFAGQISGVEGYVESAASGLLAGLTSAALVRQKVVVPPPRTTALGALCYYVSHANPVNYQPTNVAFGLLPALDRPPRQKRARRQAMARRALADLDVWQAALPMPTTVHESERPASVVS